MALMDEEELSTEIKEAIADWFTAEELVEFLNIKVNDIIDVFEDEILDKYEELLDELRWYDEPEDVHESIGKDFE